MRVRDLIGRKIVAVRQDRFRDRGKLCWSLGCLHLDNGSRLVLVALESEHEPFVSARILRPPAEGGAA